MSHNINPCEVLKDEFRRITDVLNTRESLGEEGDETFRELLRQRREVSLEYDERQRAMANFDEIYAKGEDHRIDSPLREGVQTDKEVE